MRDVPHDYSVLTCHRAALGGRVDSLPQAASSSFELDASHSSSWRNYLLRTMSSCAHSHYTTNSGARWADQQREVPVLKTCLLLSSACIGKVTERKILHVNRRRSSPSLR